VRGTSGNPDTPGVTLLGTGAGHEGSVVAAENEVSRLVNLPSLSLCVARVALLAGVLKNTLACLLVSNHSSAISWEL
jgi:hypothetical protein